MKTAKQEAIEKAYDLIGLKWKDIEGYVDVMGCIEIDTAMRINKNFNINEVDNIFGYIRPKSLNGIETNNGWIRIESEDDLPKERYGLYHVHSKEPIFSEETYYGTDDFWQNDRKKVHEWLEMYSHYQPIQKPSPPIY